MNTKDVKVDLDALERAALAAKPGKWTWKQVGTFNTPGCAVLWPDTSKGGVHYRRIDSGGGMEQADADFIAAANPAVVLELIRRLREAEAVIEKCRAALNEVTDLVSESSGVYGLHLNGDVSPWDEILAGGRFERLTSLDEAVYGIKEVK